MKGDMLPSCPGPLVDHLLSQSPPFAVSAVLSTLPKKDYAAVAHRVILVKPNLI